MGLLSSVFGDNRFSDSAHPNAVKTASYEADEFWAKPLWSEMETIWGEHPLFKNEIGHLAYMAFLTSYYDSDLDDIRNRREIQKEFMRGAERNAGIFSKETVDRYGKALPCGSFVKKVIHNVCDKVYLSRPRRIWTGDDDRDEHFRRLAKSSGIDAAFLDAYRLAKLCNVVEVGPYTKPNGKLGWHILTPDMYRVVAGDGSNKEQLHIPCKTLEEKGKRRSIFEVWTKEEHYYTDHKGQRLEGYNGGDGANHYGRIPYATLRMKEARTKDYWGSAWYEIASIQVFNNVVQLAETRDAFFNSFSFLLAINMDIGKNKLVFAPDRITELNGVTTGNAVGSNQDLPPDLKSIEQGGSYLAVQQWRQNAVREMMSNEGIPRHYFEDIGQPPTGKALEKMEEEVNNQRKADEMPLEMFEEEAAEVMATVANVEGVSARLERGLLLEQDFTGNFSVQFSFNRSAYIEDDTEDYALQKEKFEDGVIYPLDFYQRYNPDSRIRTDEDAVKAMNDNKHLINSIVSDQADTDMIPVSDSDE